MTNVLENQRQIAALGAFADKVAVSADVWSSLLSLAAACAPALAQECVVELLRDGAQLQRATVGADGNVTVEVADPLPTTRELMLSQASRLVVADLVAIPVVSAPDGDPYVGVVTCRGTRGAAAHICELLSELVRRINCEIDRAQLARALAAERERTVNLQIALASSRQIGMAIGIVIERSGCTADDAFATLRRESQDANRKLRDIAGDIVLTGEVPGLTRVVPRTGAVRALSG